MAVTAVRLPMVNGNITKGNNSIECKKVILFRYYLLDILINISISIVNHIQLLDAGPAARVVLTRLRLLVSRHGGQWTSLPRAAAPAAGTPQPP